MGGTRKTRFLADRLRHLTRLGLLMPPEYRELEAFVPAIALEQAANPVECPIMDLPDGRTLYLIWLSLVATVPGTRLDFFRIEPPWPDSNFEALPRFEGSHVGDYYKLPGGLDFPREDILNFNFVKSGWRLPGNRVEGLRVRSARRQFQKNSNTEPRSRLGCFFLTGTGQQFAATTVQFWAEPTQSSSATSETAWSDSTGAKPKVASDPPTSCAVAASGCSSPPSRRLGTGLWEPRLPEAGRRRPRQFTRTLTDLSPRGTR